MNKEAFRKISYGLYLVSSVKDGKFNGQIANSMFQVTSKPSTIAVSINKENLTHSYIQASRVFSVSILSEETPMTFIGLFGFKSGRDIDKFKNAGFQEPGLYNAEIQKSYYFVDTGLIAQNVYLAASALGLASWFHNCNKPEITRVLKLNPNQRALFGQTIGYSEN